MSKPVTKAATIGVRFTLDDDAYIRQLAAETDTSPGLYIVGYMTRALDARRNRLPLAPRDTIHRSSQDRQEAEEPT